MTTRDRILPMMLVAVAIAAPGYGQSVAPGTAPPAEPRAQEAGLSLDAAIARAIEQEPSLRAGRADVDVMRGLRDQAALRPNPTINVERRDETTGTGSQTSLGIQWPLDLFRRTGRIETAEREVEVSALAVLDQERHLAADVRLQYGLAATAVREVGVADELVATAQRQLEVVRARVEEGRTPPLERDLLQVEVGRYTAMRLLARGRADAELVALKQLLGLPPGEPLRLQDTIDTLVAGPAATLMPGEAPPVRADLREAAARVALAEARIAQAEREGRFDVAVFASYMRMDAGFPQRGFAATGALERIRGQFHNVAGGAMVLVPLFDRNQGRVAAARAERSAAEARREAVDLAVRAEVAAAQARDARARAAVHLYATSVRALARQNLDVVRQTFDLGRATVFDVLSEQRRYLEVEQGYTEALREAWQARAALGRALGELR